MAKTLTPRWSLLSSHTSQASICCCPILRITVRTVLFQSRHPSFIHFSLQKTKRDTRKDLRDCLLDCGTINSSVQEKCCCHLIKHTLEILSLLHWLTPLLTLTTHSTALFRACCTSSRAGTMVMLGMERVTWTLNIAWWPLLLPWLGESLSATGWENTTWCNSKIEVSAQ